MTTDVSLTSVQASLDTSAEPDSTLSKLMELLCEALACDRCFLYLRNPETRQGKVSHCYAVDARWPDLRGETWIEAEDAGEKDPLMAIAFRTPEPVYVDDIETAGPDILNLDYERESFGHRALIHVPVYDGDQLIGILEPCVFGSPRIWTEADRAMIAAVQPKLGAIARAYVQQFPWE